VKQSRKIGAYIWYLVLCLLGLLLYGIPVYSFAVVPEQLPTYLALSRLTFIFSVCSPFLWVWFYRRKGVRNYGSLGILPLRGACILSAVCVVFTAIINRETINRDIYGMVAGMLCGGASGMLLAIAVTHLKKIDLFPRKFTGEGPWGRF
jgi:hypothetical protein